MNQLSVFNIVIPLMKTSLHIHNVIALLHTICDQMVMKLQMMNS